MMPNTTPASPPAHWQGASRLGGLRRFAAAITVLNLLGHTVLGFEQSWAQPLAALAAAYATELVLEAFGARAAGRPPKYAGGPRRLVDFLLPAHISGLAVAMLLYASDRLAPVAFAAVVAIASKLLVRVRSGPSVPPRHVLNPSNFGITATLLLFPAVGIAPPYQFTENLSGAGDWVLPAVIVASGSFLNARFTHRVPLILAWAGGFAAQAAVRAFAFGTPAAAPLGMMTGVAFVLFSFYMVTDPATTPEAPGAQVAFGLGTAAAYSALVTAHVVYGLFFALSLTCAARGAWLWATAWRARRVERAAPAPIRTPLPAPVVLPAYAASTLGFGAPTPHAAEAAPRARPGAARP